MVIPTTSRRKRAISLSRAIGCLAGLGLSFAGLGLSLAGCSAPPADAAEPSELRVERGEMVGRLLLTGELVADDAVLMIVPNANIWPVSVRWLVEDGVEVEAGARVAEFDGSQLANELENLENQVTRAESSLASAHSQAESSVEAARFELASKQAAYEKAQIKADVPSELLAEQELAQRRLDLGKATLELEQARQGVEAAEAAGRQTIEIEALALAKAERALERSRHDLEALDLTAPRDGIALVAFNDREGRPFQTGDSTFPGSTVVTLPNLESLRVEAQLFDVDDGRVHPGQPVTATLDAFPDWHIRGTVRSIDSIADQAGRGSTRRRFRVAVTLEEVDTERMRPGMSVKLEVHTEPRQVLLVPREALVFTDEVVGDVAGDVVGDVAGEVTGEVAGQIAAARRRDGTLVRVELGDCTPSQCEALAGLDEGERLAGAAW